MRAARFCWRAGLRTTGRRSFSRALNGKCHKAEFDEGEEPFAAAKRELFEETGVSKAEVLGETDWMTYDFPPYTGPAEHRLAKYRGQKQKWFAFRFSGADHEIDVTSVRGGQQPEFDRWRWERLALLPQLVVPFKRDVYTQVARAFSSFAR